MTAFHTKLGLGTVQFGLDYGATNTDGKVCREEVKDILQLAHDSGIRFIDTAAAYGDSEELLGELLTPSREFHIITKTVALRREKITFSDIQQLQDGLITSLQRLRRSSVGTILVHHADDLLSPGGEYIYDLLCEWRESHITTRIGVSVYDAEQVNRLFERYDFEVVQLPASVFDQRMLQNGTLAEFARRNVAVHVRSIFLQGLLLMKPEQIPQRFSPWRTLLERYHAHLVACGVTPIEAAIGFACRLPGVEAALVGVLSRAQLDECIAVVEHTLDLSQFACADLALVDPRRWTN